MAYASTETRSRRDALNLQDVAGRVAIGATLAALVALAALHVLSPDFSPAWRVVSEYALGRYPWLLSMMFACWGIGAWALVVALWSELPRGAGRVGLGFLVTVGAGEVMASVFDVTHEIGHGVAGVLGVIGFPIAALLVTTALTRRDEWLPARRTLLVAAHGNWISVVLLVATLAIMTMQVARANGGHLPDHAPKALPAGVLGLDGWADRLIVVTNCFWVLVVARWAIRLRRGPTKTATQPEDCVAAA